MRITELNFFKFLKQSDIICLLNYIEDNKHIMEEEKVTEAKFLYFYFKYKYNREFDPLVTLKYVYMYCPKKYVGLPMLSLSLTVEKMKEHVNKYKHVYEIEELGIHPYFEALEEINGFRQIKTRQEIWFEAASELFFIDAFRFWQPSWVERRAIFCYNNDSDELVLVLRRISYKIIITEVKSKNGRIVDVRTVNRLQSIIDLITKEVNRKKLAPKIEKKEKEY
ncbi:MAG: hypothetical protein N4A35_01445 [Flavobacteriales bacterium]|jgi:hypothetical protein|nr:hypothetical protein [Flavobacteriales bacterium]